MNCLGSWRVERCWLQSPPLSCYMTRVLEIFLQRPTIALLLYRISHVTYCVCVLTKALLVFTLLLKIAYVEPMVGEMEACTCVTYFAKSNNGSMEMTNQTSWSRLCTCVESGWCKQNTPFMDLSPFYLDNMRTWLYICIYFFLGPSCVQIFFNTRTFMCLLFFGLCFLGMPSFLSLFFNSSCLFWVILERERDH